MFVHPGFDPIAVSIGPLAVRWYGLMYVVGFALVWWFGRMRIKANPNGIWQQKDLDDVMFYAILGVILGGRFGYVLFYKFGDYIHVPWKIFYVWEGGMSFHGGMLGVIVAMVWYAYSRKKPFWQVIDFCAPCVPTGLAAGRVGNFINGELPGRLADPSLPWGMVFRGYGDLPRHPSQIYQFLLEGLLLFVLLWLYARKERKEGQVAAAFSVGYGLLRFIAEFFREPDAHLGILSLGMSMGQWLCVPMIVGGAALWLWADKRNTGGN